MHFSIPDTKDFSSFVGYNIFVNGSFHCCLRYKQLHSLHEQLKRSLPNLILPSFPPKKLLSLTKNELEQRRLALERYLQLIGQDPVLSKSNLLRSFLLNAQQESALIESYETTIDVYLMNGFRITIGVFTNECSMKVLEKALKSIDLPDDYIYYFGIFLMRKDNNNGDITIVRKLMDFESPFITLKTSNECRIIIRKNYWDPQYDLELMHDKIALNLLYIQTLSDVEHGWIKASNDIKDQLSTLQARGNKKDYMKLVSNLPSYGCIQFSNVISDYPDDNHTVTIIIGNKELGIRTNFGKKIQETKFKVTRMRCWRVTTILNDENDKKKNAGQVYTYELSFEYLMAKNILKWIKLVTEQAMLISVCLQSMVDELLNQKNGYDINNIQANLDSNTHLDYIRRDNSSNRLSDSSSNSSISNISELNVSNRNHPDTKVKKRIKDKVISTTVLYRKESVHNEAFETITDEDL